MTSRDVTAFGASHYDSASITEAISKSTWGRKIKSSDFLAHWSIFHLFPRRKCRTSHLHTWIIRKSTPGALHQSSLAGADYLQNHFFSGGIYSVVTHYKNNLVVLIHLDP